MANAPSPDQSAVGNRLLDSLPPNILNDLRSRFETVTLAISETILAPGKKAEYAFFPTSGMVSIVAVMADGAMVEIGLVGNEGMLGISAMFPYLTG